ncbi:MAG TPA: hypothetical protein VHV51_14090 [Polyangiaceae bacterium]|jgi:hypothetical protein|nr:hypothetical protein [Polyangiaceae bacterium]
MFHSHALSCATLGLCALVSAGCVGTTGGNVVDFDAAASGPTGAGAGAPLDFSNSLGWQIELTTAKLHVGAIYLVQTQPTSGAQGTDCILPGTYVAQVTDGLDVDLLSGEAQPFPVRGHGTTELALSGQVWLTQGPVDEAEQPANLPILSLEGSATRAGEVRPFSAALTISSSNRLPNASTSEFASPICKQRVVSPILTAVQIEERGGLLLRVDPRLFFVNVDFGALTLGPDGVNFVFADDSSDQPSANLYQNLRASGGLYTFSWVPNL